MNQLFAARIVNSAVTRPLSFSRDSLFRFSSRDGAVETAVWNSQIYTEWILQWKLLQNVVTEEWADILSFHLKRATRVLRTEVRY